MQSDAPTGDENPYAGGTDVAVCPVCGSPNIGPRKMPVERGWPGLAMSTHDGCLDCGVKWQARERERSEPSERVKASTARRQANIAAEAKAEADEADRYDAFGALIKSKGAKNVE